MKAETITTRSGRVHYKSTYEAAAKYGKTKKGIEVTRNGVIKFRKTKRGVFCMAYNGQKRRYPVEYTLDMFFDRFINDKAFNRIFDEWVKSGYAKNKKPSFDRINFRKHYTLDNISVKTWADNRYKQRMEIKLITGKPVVAVVNGVIIHRYINQHIAARKMGCQQASISDSCRMPNKMAAGFKWMFLKDYEDIYAN